MNRTSRFFNSELIAIFITYLPDNFHFFLRLLLTDPSPSSSVHKEITIDALCSLPKGRIHSFIHSSILSSSKMFSRKTVCSISMFMIFMFLVSSISTISLDFYHDSCPHAETMVREIVRSASEKDSTVPGKLLRLLFHDCMVEVTNSKSQILSMCRGD